MLAWQKSGRELWLSNVMKLVTFHKCQIFSRSVNNLKVKGLSKLKDEIKTVAQNYKWHVISINIMTAQINLATALLQYVACNGKFVWASSSFFPISSYLINRVRNRVYSEQSPFIFSRLKSNLWLCLCSQLWVWAFSWTALLWSTCHSKLRTITPSFWGKNFGMNPFSRQRPEYEKAPLPG